MGGCGDAVPRTHRQVYATRMPANTTSRRATKPGGCDSSALARGSGSGPPAAAPEAARGGGGARGRAGVAGASGSFAGTRAGCRGGPVARRRARAGAPRGSRGRAKPFIVLRDARMADARSVDADVAPTACSVVSWRGVPCATGKPCVSWEHDLRHGLRHNAARITWQAGMVHDQCPS
jgi:hypothetical protein